MVLYPTPEYKDSASAIAISHRFVAFATVVRDDTCWTLNEAISRLFHLREETPQAWRNIVIDVYGLTSEHGIKSAPVCRTLTGDLDNEARLEAALGFVPNFEPELVDVDMLLHWSAREKPICPANVVRSHQHPVQLCAIELAQFKLCTVPERWSA